MPWNKGLTKFTSSSVLKISRTFKQKRIDNFRNWRESMKHLGKIPSSYPSFQHSESLAELIGVILGDGNISNFPRTERLLVVGNANNPKVIENWKNLLIKVFHKTPTISRVSGTNTIRISLYQKFISKRLGIPNGNRTNYEFITPNWILNNKNYLIHFLKGLFESEGSLSIHNPTYTYNFAFRNNNKFLLDAVSFGLIKLGYNPEVRNYAVRLRRKIEVESFRNLIYFRE